MSKLTLEQAKKIGHLFDGVLGKNVTTGVKYLRRQIDLGEMLDWIFNGSEINYRLEQVDKKTWQLAKWDEKSKDWDIVAVNKNAKTMAEFIQMDAENWTEAAYKAICIIEGIEP